MVFVGERLPWVRVGGRPARWYAWLAGMARCYRGGLLVCVGASGGLLVRVGVKVAGWYDWGGVARWCGPMLILSSVHMICCACLCSQHSAKHEWQADPAARPSASSICVVLCDIYGTVKLCYAMVSAALKVMCSE